MTECCSVPNSYRMLDHSSKPLLWDSPVSDAFPNLNLLVTLKVLLEERHVTLAARRLCLTQSAVSKG